MQRPEKMNKVNYKLSLEAEEDLIRIYRYGLNKFGKDQATDYYFGLIETFEQIAANPFQFALAENVKAGYRSRSYKADTIYYRITDEVEIMAVIGSQNFKK